MADTRSLQLGDRERADPRDVADRQVDLAEQEDEDDAVRQHRRAGHLDDDVAEVLGREEVRRLEAEEDDDEDERDDDREDAQVARADVRRRAAKQPGQPGGLFLFRSRAPVLADDLDVGGRHAGAAVAGIPETFVGRPAVIAWTTSCCVVLSRWNTPTFLPRRSTVIRCAVSKTSWRLCEMMTTARPCSASRRTSASTCSVCATPRAAVGSSRTTSFEFHITARATATDCR